MAATLPAMPTPAFPSSDPLAAAAVAPIASGMTVGLGTGRAAARGIRALAEKVLAQNLRIQCAATSRESAELARSLGLSLVGLAETEHLDYLFDGADEVDGELGMIKGGHGAVVGERLAASIAARRVYLVQRSKVVARLGVGRATPLVILPEALGPARAALRRLGMTAALRGAPGEPFRTDDGHLVLDVVLGDVEARDAAERFNAIAGAVDHGLFIDECDLLIVEEPDGELERMERTSLERTRVERARQS